MASATLALPRYSLTILPGDFAVDELRVTEGGTPYVAQLPFAGAPNFYGWAVNSSGVYAGACLPLSHMPAGGACTYSAAAGVQTVDFDHPPSTLQQWYSTYAYDVNERGDILGGATDWNQGNTNLNLQIRTAEGDLILLPGISSYRRASFNDAHQIVGAGIVADAFYYADGVRTPLSDLVANSGSFRFWTPTDINEAGYIVGIGTDGTDDLGRPIRRGFLLSPALVPEPSPGALAAAAAVFMGLRMHARRRRR